MTHSKKTAFDTLLSRFFGEGNEILPESVENATTSVGRCTQLWIEDFRSKGQRIILPRKQGQDFTWYAISQTEGDFGDLREQLLAFVGPSYSTFRGERARLSENDRVEAALIEFFGPNPMAFKFTPAQDSLRRKQLIESLSTMYHVCAAARTRPPDVMRPTGGILRDFYLSLSAGNRCDAESALNYLRDTRRLDALNLQFLEIKLRSELELWQEIVDLPNLAVLLQARRPRAVTGALIKAVYRCYIAEFEARKDTEGACKLFREEIRPRYDSLYNARLGLSDPDVLKSFMLVAMTEATQRSDLRDEILAVPDIPQTDLDFLISLSQLIPPLTAKMVAGGDLACEAHRAVGEMRYDDAVRLAQYDIPLLDRARVLLECSYETQSLAVEKAAVDTVRCLTPEQRDELLRSRKYQSFWRDIATLAEPTEGLGASVPAHWLEWLEMLTDSSVSDMQTLRWAEKGVDEWELGALLSLPDISMRFSRALERVGRERTGKQRLHDALPHLIRFLEADPEFPRIEFRTIYERIRMELSYECEAGAASDFAIFGELCEAELILGAQPADYQAVLEEARNLWERFASPSNLQPMLDTLDRLLYFPCPAGFLEDRGSLASSVFSRSVPWLQVDRIDVETTRFMELLSKEYELHYILEDVLKPCMIEESSDAHVDPLAKLAGTLAVYTLMRSSGLRIRHILAQRSPDCKVELSHELVGSPKLRDLARNADVVIVATRSAKHAVTSFIDKHRKGKPTLRPIGRGTSSILSALVQYVEGGGAMPA